MYIHICEFQVPMDSSRLNPDQATFRYVIIKLSKVKDRILSSTKENTEVIYKGTP